MATSRIGAWIRAKRPDLTTAFYPPCSRATLQKLASQRGVVLPEEVYQLYSWHNGMGKGKQLFGSYRFLPIEEAFAAAGHFPATEHGPFGLPIFESTDGRSVYQVTCPNAPAAASPVVLAAEGPEELVTSTLAAFVQALAISFEKGVFNGSDEDGIKPAFYQTLLEFQPERKHAVDLLLSGSDASLSKEARIQAYSDLESIAHPRLDELLRAGAVRWMNDRDTTFRLFDMLALSRVPANFSFLEQMAQRSEPAVRKQAYLVLAWQLPREWVLDPKTEEVALADLSSVLFSELDRRDVARVLGHSRDRRPVPALISTLNSEIRDTRVEAAFALGRLGDPSAIPALRQRAALDRDPGVQNACLYSIADLGDRDTDKEIRRRLEAACALTRRLPDHPTKELACDALLKNMMKPSSSPSMRRVAEQMWRDRHGR